MSVDYPDFQTPQQHADTIARTGVPLLTLASDVLAQTFTPAAGATSSSISIPITQIGYEIMIIGQFIVAPTNPFARVTLTWSQSGITGYTDTETFIVPCGSAGTSFKVIGRGPTRGDSVVVSVTNLDPLQVISLVVNLAENSRIYDRSQWRWDNAPLSGVTVAGWTLPFLPADESVLGILDNTLIPASSGIQWLFGMHNGLVQFQYEMNTGLASALTVRFQAAPTSEYLTHYSLGAASPGSFGVQFAGPRAPIVVRLVNTSAAGINVSCSLLRAQTT